MKYVILAGGLGTRLRPYTFSVPKPLLPLGNKTLLDYVIAQIKKYSPSEIIISVGYQAELIKAYCQQGQKYDVPISYIDEQTPLGTAGCLSLVKERFDEKEPFILMNGDIVTQLDFNKLRDFHISNKAVITVGIVKYTYQSPYGVLELDGDRLKNIVEKPTYEYSVSAGIYCINKEAVFEIPHKTFFTMPELMIKIKNSKKSVFVYEIQEYWRALETKDQFEEVLQKQVVE